MDSDNAEIIKKIQACLGDAQKLLTDIATRPAPVDEEFKRDVRELIDHIRGEKRLVGDSPETIRKRTRRRTSTVHTGDEDNEVGHSQHLTRSAVRASNVQKGDDDTEVQRSRIITRPPIRALKPIGGDFHDSFVNAPLQCFAAVIDPQELLDMLDTEFVGPHSSENTKMKPELKSCRSEVNRQLEGYKKKSADERPSPVAEFIDTIKWMKNGRTQALYAYRLQKMFSFVAHDYDGDRPGDAASWVKDMIHCLSIGKSYDRDTAKPAHGRSKTVRSLFWMQEALVERCRTCKDVSSEGPAGWVLDLFVAGPAPVTLAALLEKKKMKELCPCRGQNRRMTWGLSRSPLILIVRLEYPTPSGAGYNGDNEQGRTSRSIGGAVEETASHTEWASSRDGESEESEDVFEDAVEEVEERGRENSMGPFDVIVDEVVVIKQMKAASKNYSANTYVLHGIVKFIGDHPDTGPYVAYVRGTKPDLYYRYEGPNVREVTSDEATKDHSSGKEHSYLLFFKKRDE